MTKDAEHPLAEMMAIVGKAGLGVLPGGGLLSAGYDALKLLSKEAAAQMERRSKKRYEEFIHSVFAGEVTPEVTEHLTADDYTALLSGCMADMENEKAKYYGRLAAAIGRGEIRGSSRRFLILTLSQISNEQLQMMRKSFVASRFDLKPSQGCGSVDPVEILHLNDPIEKHEHSELVSRSMYSESKLTALAEVLVQACFTVDELKPSAINYVAWFPSVIDIIFDSDLSALICSLTDAFSREAIRASNRSIAGIDRMMLGRFASPRVMIVGTELKPGYLPELKARLKGCDVLFVCLYDHEMDIKNYYPDSTILNVEGRSVAEITVEVVNYVKVANGLTQAA